MKKTSLSQGDLFNWIFAMFLYGSMSCVAVSVEVELVTPKRGEIHRFTTLPGTVSANQKVTLYGKVSGYLKAIHVDRGDWVEAGRLIAELEVPELDADWIQAQAELKVAEAEWKRLSDAKDVSPDLIVPRALDEAEGRVETTRARLERLETLLHYAKLTAPFDGIVTDRFVDPGAFIPAATSGSVVEHAALITLMDIQTVRLRVPTPEVEAVKVRNGQPVRFAVDSLPGKEFSATISRFSFAIDPSSQTMLAEADVPNPDWILRPGMFASVHIGLDSRQDVLLVPLRSVVFEKAGAFVFLPQAGKAGKSRVTTGFNDGRQVEIQSGLSGDESILVPLDQPIKDGDTVSIKEP